LLTDNCLVERIRRGDSEAFRVLHLRHADRLLKLIYRYVGNWEDAEDICQGTFLNVYKYLDTFKGGNVPAWLSRIAINEVNRYWKRYKHGIADDQLISIDTVTVETKEGRAGRPIQEMFPSNQDLPADTLLYQEKAVLLQRFINRLPDEQKQVIELRIYAELPYSEIATILEITAANARKRYTRGIRELKKIIVNQPDEIQQALNFEGIGGD
jgi:RNA polymerase sigma-70 factor, ECF subfamily